MKVGDTVYMYDFKSRVIACFTIDSFTNDGRAVVFNDSSRVTVNLTAKEPGNIVPRTNKNVAVNDAVRHCRNLIETFNFHIDYRKKIIDKEKREIDKIQEKVKSVRNTIKLLNLQREKK